MSGDAGRWTVLGQVMIRQSEDQGGRCFKVESSRAYRDRLVLKLRDVNDAGTAAELRGQGVWVPESLVPPLPEGTHYRAHLIGLRVVDDRAGEIGRVSDLIETGGADLLVVEDGRGGEVLVPMARSIVLSVDEQSKRIDVRLPDGLRDLNRAGGAAT